MIEVEVKASDGVDVEVGKITVVNTSKPVEIGSGLKLEGNVLSVDTADKVEEDNTKPVTSEAVHKELNNYIKSDEMTSAVESALQTAKDSGEFNGPPGAPYKLTEADKSEIVNAVITALHVWNGGAY